jgi:hypothetical protein
MIDASEALQYMAAVLNDYEAQNQILRAENARYKAALEQIETATIEYTGSQNQALGCEEWVIKTIGKMPAIARAALGKGELNE